MKSGPLLSSRLVTCNSDTSCEPLLPPSLRRNDNLDIFIENFWTCTCRRTWRNLIEFYENLLQDSYPCQNSQKWASTLNRKDTGNEKLLNFSFRGRINQLSLRISITREKFVNIFCQQGSNFGDIYEKFYKAGILIYRPSEDIGWGWWWWCKLMNIINNIASHRSSIWFSLQRWAKYIGKI